MNRFYNIDGSLVSLFCTVIGKGFFEGFGMVNDVLIWRIWPFVHVLYASVIILSSNIQPYNHPNAFRVIY
jgi:hypothetical protein